MMRSEYAANLALQTPKVKAKDAMQATGKTFAERLAALQSCDTNKGKVW